MCRVEVGFSEPEVVQLDEPFSRRAGLGMKTADHREQPLPE